MTEADTQARSVVIWVGEGTWRAAVDAALDLAPAGARFTLLHVTPAEVPSQTQMNTERAWVPVPVTVDQPPSRCSPAHSASTPRTTAAGTVSSPSLVNSPRSGAEP